MVMAPERRSVSDTATLLKTGTVSVVVPTRNEASNIRPLTDAVIDHLRGSLEEIIFVDDSTDDTPDVIVNLTSDSDVEIILIHRPPEQRHDGLSGAVIAGLKRARGDWVCVMDGDLQHPPEVIPAMLSMAELEDLDLVSAGRFAAGNETEMSRSRKALSHALIRAVHHAFVPLRQLRDPLTGFFVVRRRAVDIERLQPLGFKILVEIIARNANLAVGEVGFEFGKREHGRSKASARTLWHFVRHILRLRRHVGNGRRHHYDIHGIITVSSPVKLPELWRFEVPHLRETATITLSCRPAALAGDDLFTYRELGRLGFGVRMRRTSSGIEIDVSRLVGKSPHVLYTNVVEPVIRWELVRRGYALVHAACVGRDGQAFLITARTDTGKTTTMLKLLDRGGLGFVSDDLIIVDPSGVVLTYPKPLTISSHTLAAVRQAELRWHERVGLKLQSRVHSRSGRRVAFALTRLPLPVATINAITQILIPPPKYDVARLIPGVAMVEKARIAGMFVIERGTPSRRSLDAATALDILLENCEDAFGFPPYDRIEAYLHGGRGETVHQSEREIIASALVGVPAVLLASDSLDWAESIAADLGTPAERSAAVDRPGSEG